MGNDCDVRTCSCVRLPRVCLSLCLSLSLSLSSSLLPPATGTLIVLGSQQNTTRNTNTAFNSSWWSCCFQRRVDYEDLQASLNAEYEELSAIGYARLSRQQMDPLDEILQELNEIDRIVQDSSWA